MDFSFIVLLFCFVFQGARGAEGRRRASAAAAVGFAGVAFHLRRLAASTAAHADRPRAGLPVLRPAKQKKNDPTKWKPPPPPLLLLSTPNATEKHAQKSRQKEEEEEENEEEEEEEGQTKS